MTHPRRHVARGTLYVVFGRGFYFGAGYLASIILARALQPSDYGIYGVVISVLLWIEQTTRFTFAPAAAKLIPEVSDDATPLERTALLLNFSLFVLLFAVLWLSAPMLADLFELDEGTFLFRLAALDLPFFGLYVIYRGVLQGRHNFFSTALGDALYAVTKLAGILLLVTIGISVASALIVNVLASLGGMIVVWSQSSIRSWKPAPIFIRPLVRIAFPLGLFMLVTQTLVQLDLWCLKVFGTGKNGTLLGQYVAARQVGFVPSFIFLGVSEVLLPALSRALARNETALSRQHVQAAMRFLWMLILPVALLLALTADNLMVFLFSNSYLEGGLFLSILAFSAVFAAFKILFASMLTARGEPYLCAIALSLLIPVGFCSNYLLIPAYGAVGAAYSSVITYFLGAAILGILAYRRFHSLIDMRSFLRITIAALAMAGVAIQFQVTGPALIGFYLANLAIYGFLLILFGEIGRDDLKLIMVWRT